MVTTDSPLSPAQVATLYTACDATQLGRRDYVMLVLLFNCGLTLRELANLQRSYVDLDARWLWVYEGLRNPRPVPLNRRAGNVLNLWLARRDARNLRYVIGRLPDCRNKISARALKNRIDAIADAAGIPFSGSQAAPTLARQLYEIEPAAHGAGVPRPPRLHALLPFSELQAERGEPQLVPNPDAWRPIPLATPALERGRHLLERVGECL